MGDKRTHNLNTTNKNYHSLFIALILAKLLNLYYNIL